MGTVVLISVFIIAFNLLVDLLYAFLDPRIRHD
jgi:oligopeptide transport system permease protein